MFKLNPKGKYPQLKQYFESNDFLRLLNNPDLRNGLKTLGGFTDDQITDMGRNGFGPEIHIATSAEMGVEGDRELNGEFRSANENGSFFLGSNLVNQFESASPENKQAALLLIVMTIFHEAVHVGVNKNSLPLQSAYGNWARKGDIYYYKNLPTGFKEGSDIRTLGKMPSVKTIQIL